MRKTTIIAAATLAVIAVSGQVRAQSTTCQGKAVIDTVYQTNTGSNRYEYYFNVRNATRTPLAIDVTFTGFPTNVTLFSPSLPGIPVGPFVTRAAIKFGRGTNATISPNTVARVYDTAAGTGPTVRLANCRPS